MPALLAAIHVNRLAATALAELLSRRRGLEWAAAVLIRWSPGHRAETMQNCYERQARNKALVREVNERIGLGRVDQATQDVGLSDDATFEFLCECGRANGPDIICVELFEMTLAEYEELRSQDDRFALVPGHETPDLEDVVRRTERYVIVDKRPEVEPFVEADSRSASSS